MHDRKVFWCECRDPEHQLVMECEDDQANALLVYYRLAPQHGFRMRLKLAWNYLFQKDLDKCQYGDISLGQSEIRRLKEYLNVEFPDI